MHLHHIEIIPGYLLSNKFPQDNTVAVYIRPTFNKNKKVNNHKYIGGTSICNNVFIERTFRLKVHYVTPPEPSIGAAYKI
jgi:hypothetical protein